MTSVCRSAGGAAALCLLLSTLSSSAHAQQNPVGLALPHTARVTDVFSPLLPDAAHLKGGMLGTRIDANAKHRLLVVDENDLLDAFERRDMPHQDWQGEHVGKFLHAATLAWQNTRDTALKAKLDRVVTRLLKTQEADGYLGTYPAAKRWKSWDVWCHKYALIGLLTYYQYTNAREQGTGNMSPRGRPEQKQGAAFAKDAGTKPSVNPDDVLAACRRMGDLLIRTFGDGPGQRDINKAGEHVGMAPDSVLEAIVLLYRATGDPRYETFADYIVRHYDAPGGPAILTSLEKTHSVRKVANAKAYEMLSNFNGILEQYRVTGTKRYLDDMRTAWQDIVDNRLYITGSASAQERFQDEFVLPDTQSASICETCVTVTWEQMNLQLLRLTGDARFADQLERSVYNHLLGAQKPTGDDWAYYTPLEGRKPYDKATTCCHSSGPRGLALIPEFATMIGADGSIVVNMYNSGTATLPLPAVPARATSKKASQPAQPATTVTLRQETNYPLDGKILLTVTPDRPAAKFPLRLRIPAWARLYTIQVNGRTVAANRLRGSDTTGRYGFEMTAAYSPSVSGGYETITRAWSKGDRVTIRLDMHPNVILERRAKLGPGIYENTGRAAVTYGPLVLALDSALNPGLPLKRLELASEDPKRYMLLRPVETQTEEDRRDSAFTKRFGLLLPVGTQTYPFPVFVVAGQAQGHDGPLTLLLTPYAWAGADGKSRFEVWMPLPGQASGSHASLFSGGSETASRGGNVAGSIADDDTDTFAVTFTNQQASEDWFAVALDKPVFLNRVTFAHGKTFHDGGWFDTASGKPLVQVQTAPGGAWKTVATLNAYPDATATNARGLKDGQTFSASFARVQAVAVRVIGKPACGDNPAQAFTSCGELQAFDK